MRNSTLHPAGGSTGGKSRAQIRVNIHTFTHFPMMGLSFCFRSLVLAGCLDGGSIRDFQVLRVCSYLSGRLEAVSCIRQDAIWVTNHEIRSWLWMSNMCYWLLPSLFSLGATDRKDYMDIFPFVSLTFWGLTMPIIFRVCLMKGATQN